MSITMTHFKLDIKKKKKNDSEGLKLSSLPSIQSDLSTEIDQIQLYLCKSRLYVGPTSTS